MPDVQGRPLIETVGRRGVLHLEFERDGSRTVLARSSCTSPWHSFPPSYLDDSGCAYTWLVNPSGGLVGGDEVAVEARLDAGTHVVMTSPSATRVYRSPSASAVQLVTLEVGADAMLEWMPETTIPYAGSRFAQTIQVALAPGSTLLLWDGMASGRVGRGERWAFADYDNEICIETASGGALIERFHLQPGSLGAFVRDWDYVVSLFVVNDSVEASRWARIQETIAVALDSLGSDVLGGVTVPSVSGLAVKLLARSSPSLAKAQEIVWDRVRRELLGLSLPLLRRY
ncbi:MAG TPA: urease accessory protein UreD [Nitrospiraceae bacterium]|nr:urease accessory protein UreD [Nitrospiraceae bacterium]